MVRRSLIIGAIALLVIAGGWWIVGRNRPAAPASPAGAPSRPDAAAPADARKITATLYFVSEDGMSLVGVQREVPFGEGVIEQARQIVIAQLGDAVTSALDSAREKTPAL